MNKALANYIAFEKKYFGNASNGDGLSGETENCFFCHGGTNNPTEALGALLKKFNVDLEKFVAAHSKRQKRLRQPSLFSVSNGHLCEAVYPKGCEGCATVCIAYGTRHDVSVLEALHTVACVIK